MFLFFQCQLCISTASTTVYYIQPLLILLLNCFHVVHLLPFRHIRLCFHGREKIIATTFAKKENVDLSSRFKQRNAKSVTNIRVNQARNCCENICKTEIFSQVFAKSFVFAKFWTFYFHFRFNPSFYNFLRAPLLPDVNL